MAKPKSKKPEKPDDANTIFIEPVRYQEITLCILGTSKYVCNKQSEKAKRELLSPSGGKSKAERAQSLKHLPFREFRDSPYTFRNPNAPTFLSMKAVTVKRAMETAALDTPGVAKAQLGRLVRVHEDYIGGNPDRPA